MSRAGRWYLGVVAAVIVVYGTVPWPLLTSGAIYVGVELAVVAAITVGVLRRGVAPRTAWAAIAVSLALWAGGDVFWWSYEHRGVAPFPSAADGLYLAGYAGLGVALWRFGRELGAGRHLGDVLDAALVTLGVGVPLWLLWMSPAIADATAGLAGRTIGGAYGLIVLVLVLLLARMLLTGVGPDRQLRWLAAAFAVLVATNLVYAGQLYQAAYDVGGWLDTGWLLSFALLGTAALEPAGRSPDPTREPGRPRPRRSRMLTLWAMALVPPTVLLLHVARGGRDPEILTVTGLATLAAFTLLTIRVAQLLRQVEEVTRTEGEQRLAALLKQIQDVVTVQDGDGRITYASPSVEHAWGYTAATLPHRLIDLVHPDDRPDVEAHLEQVAAGDPGSAARFEARVRRADGSWCPTVTTATNQLADPAIGGVVTTHHDASEQAARERHLRQRADHEAEVASQLRELEEMKNTFLGAISHDLRTPLTSVRGISELLATRHDELDEHQRRALSERVAANAQRLEQLVLDLLDLDRLTRGTVQPMRAAVDAAAVVRRIREQGGYGQRAITAPDVAVHAEVDPVMLERILENLLSNAARHTPVAASIHVGLHPLPDRGLRIVVDDDGPGIPEPDRARVLDAFTRLDGSRGGPGTGVGLSLVAGFARLHGGSVRVDEAPGGGARFTVELPGRV